MQINPDIGFSCLTMFQNTATTANKYDPAIGVSRKNTIFETFLNASFYHEKDTCCS